MLKDYYVIKEVHFKITDLIKKSPHAMETKLACYTNSLLDPKPYCGTPEENQWGVFILDQVTCKACLKKLLENGEHFKTPLSRIGFLNLEGEGSITELEQLQLKAYLSK